MKLSKRYSFFVYVLIVALLFKYSISDICPSSIMAIMVSRFSNNKELFLMPGSDNLLTSNFFYASFLLRLILGGMLAVQRDSVFVSCTSRRDPRHFILCPIPFSLALSCNAHVTLWIWRVPPITRFWF